MVADRVPSPAALTRRDAELLHRVRVGPTSASALREDILAHLAGLQQLAPLASTPDELSWLLRAVRFWKTYLLTALDMVVEYRSPEGPFTSSFPFSERPEVKPVPDSNTMGHESSHSLKQSRNFPFSE